MDVAYIFDENFAECAIVSIKSLIDTNLKNNIKLWILNDGISTESLIEIRNMLKSENINYSIIDLSTKKQIFEQLGVTPWRGGYTVYFKIMISALIPQDIKRLIFIDADTVIAGDLSDLENLNLHGHPCAMALEGITGRFHKHSKLGIYELYNSGVIVYDMQKWKEKDVEQRALEYWKKENAKLVLCEEETLSIVLKDDIETLNPKFNFIPQFFFYDSEFYFKKFQWDKLKDRFYSVETVKNAKKDIRVYHCIDTMTGRPWEKGNCHPYKKIYNEYRKKTCFKTMELKEPNLIFRHKVMYKLRKILPHKLSIYFNYLMISYEFGTAVWKKIY